MEPDKLQLEILRIILFTEPFSRIVEECTLTRDKNIVADGLKLLMKNRLARPMKASGEGYVASLVYDSDHMDHYFYQATAKGIKLLETL